MNKSILTVLTVTLICLAFNLSAQSSLMAFRSGGEPAANSSTLFLQAGNDEGNIIFYPNPVKDYLNVKFPVRGNYTIRVFNIVGEKVAEKTVYEDNIVRINLLDLNAGMYFLSYEFNGRVLTRTFSKAQ